MSGSMDDKPQSGGGIAPRHDSGPAANSNDRPPVAATSGGALALFGVQTAAPIDTGFMNPGRMIRRGLWVIVIFVVGSVTWASTAPLESSVSAPATIIVESHRKTIQHLEGGIVKQVLVAEGETVSAGQPLLRLEETQAQSNFS